MTTPPKSTRVAPAKVQAIRPAPKTIEPPEGWVLNSAFGFMRFDNTPAGVLVRLADVVRWLESSQSLPREKALETLCNALTPEAMQWLYWVDKTQYAKPVPADYMWGYMTAAQIEAQKYSQRQADLQRAHEDAQMSWGEFRGSQSAHIQAGKISFSKPDPTEPGLPAFLKAIRACWSRPKFNQAATVDILEDTRPPYLATAAMRLDKAFELWGYGRDASTTSEAPEIPVVGWTGEKLAAQQAVFKAEGHKNFAQRTWELAGIGERDGRRLIEEYNATQTPAHGSLITSVFDMGMAASKKVKKKA